MADSIYVAKEPEANEPAVCQTWPPSNTRKQGTHRRIVYTLQNNQKQSSQLSARHGHLVTPGDREHTMADTIFVRKEPEAKEPAVPDMAT